MVDPDNDKLYFYEATTNNVKLPPGAFLAQGAAIQRWVETAGLSPLTLNLTATVGEARVLIEEAVTKVFPAAVLVCYRPDPEPNKVRMLIFKSIRDGDDLEEYHHKDAVPSWWCWSYKQMSRYDKLAGDDEVV